MSRRASRFTVLPMLALAAAVAIWIFDAYRQAEGIPAKSGEYPISSGRYETFHGCSLAQDRGNDGDSFRVKMPGGRNEIVRLYFVDTPENGFKTYSGGRSNHDRIAQQAADLGGITPQQAVVIGKQAKVYALSILAAAPFTLHTEWDDPFGDRRYHAFVELTHNGKTRFLHELLVEKGLARIHTKGAPLPDGTPEHEHEDRLFDLQSHAKSKEAGAWGLLDHVPMKAYTLKTCETCRKAVKWLRENGIPFEEIPIREQPPTLPELRLAMKSADGDIRKLFNTSGQDYRALNLKESLPTMSDSDALALLASNGNLIKRPFLVSGAKAMAGFDPQKWCDS